MSAIVVEDLSKQFPREPRPAVDHVSFQADDGAFVVLLWRTRVRWLALPALVIPLYFYTYRLCSEPPTALMADCEHLIHESKGGLKVTQISAQEGSPLPPLHPRPPE